MSTLLTEHQPNFGVYHGGIHAVDPRNYRQKSFSDLWLPLREKRWQYIGVYSDSVIAGLAVFHGGYLGNIFVYVYDRASGLFWEQERTAVMAAGIRVDRNVHTGVVSYMAEDERIRIDNDLEHHSRRVDVKLKHDGRTVDMRLEIKDDWSKLLPHQVVTPTAKGQFSFTHKAAGLPIFGSILIGDRRIELNPESSRAAIDYTVGYHDHKTNWNWASAAGQTDDGTQIGLNLVHPVHHPKFHENVLWINGQPLQLGEAQFSYGDPSKRDIWNIQSHCGRVKLDFQPLGLRAQNINYGLLSSRFFQPFGLYSGTVIGNDGQSYRIRDMPGVAEEHCARW
ncbi:MAG: DUF2804 domain-containing protein, partial [Myxococcota bacterium]|nr:DUF2804 domain-containing protein [Myxococcota bacterium]